MRMRNWCLISTLFTAVVTASILVRSADAAPVVSTVNSPGGPPAELVYSPDVSNTDLLHGLSGGDVTTTGSWAGGGAAWLNNGVHGDSFDNIGAPAASQIAWPTVGSSVTYNLGLGDNGLGFDITEIQSIAAWQSAGFGNQGYDIEVQLKDAAGFIPLETVQYNPFNDSAGATRVNITDDTGVLASGVEFLRFTHNSVPGSNSGRVTYRELDVFGASTAASAVPEPTSFVIWTLLGVGLAGLARFSARRTK